MGIGSSDGDIIQPADGTRIVPIINAD